MIVNSEVELSVDVILLSLASLKNNENAPSETRRLDTGYRKPLQVESVSRASS